LEVQGPVHDWLEAQKLARKTQEGGAGNQGI
jgi:hypothetical protein